VSVEDPADAAVPDTHQEDGSELPPIPDALLAPLLDSAGEALRRLPPADLPPAARRLRSFDRRGLATPAARHQLRTLLEENEAVLAATAAVFRARPEVARLAEAWDEAMAAGGDAPMTLVLEAAGDGRLPLLASVLIAGLPECFEFGLGLVVAMAATAERESEAEAAARAATAGQRAAEEAARRAEAARTTADAEAARLDAALREERQARRDRDQHAADAAAGTEARRAELETALAEAHQQVAAAEDRAAAAGQRAAEAERRAADAEHRAAESDRRAAESDRRAAAAATEAAVAEDRARRAEGRTPPAQVPTVAPAGGQQETPGRGRASAPVDDPAVLQQIAHAAEELAAGLRRLADGSPPRPPPRPSDGSPPRPPPRSADPPPGPPPGPRRSAPPSPGNAPRQTSPARRAPVRLPPGMLQDDPAAIEAMIRTPGLAVIVDGYNVSMLAWPDASPAEQRERLCDALTEFQLRFRCEVTVVFDGAEVPGVRPLRRRGLRIVFSAAGQEADEVVVGEVMFRPAEVPVIVVSSDREVRTAAESEGATVLAADELLQLMRR
jgi:predicted RNA-binding protein with PIN domain